MNYYFSGKSCFVDCVVSSFLHWSPLPVLWKVKCVCYSSNYTVDNGVSLSSFGYHQQGAPAGIALKMWICLNHWNVWKTKLVWLKIYCCIRDNHNDNFSTAFLFYKQNSKAFSQNIKSTIQLGWLSRIFGILLHIQFAYDTER